MPEYILQGETLRIPGENKIAYGFYGGADAFNRPTPGVTTLILEEGVEVIGKNAFSNYPDLKSVVFPQTLTRIEENGFKDCVSLEEVVLPDSVTFIGVCAFWCCTSLRTLELPKNLQTMRCSAFYGCSSIESVRSPKSLTVIEDGVFQNCSGITSVEIPEGVEVIEDFSFADTHLKTLSFPSSIKKVGHCVFPTDAIIFLPPNAQFEGQEHLLTKMVQPGDFPTMDDIPEAPSEETSEEAHEAAHEEDTPTQEDCRENGFPTSSSGGTLQCPRCRSTSISERRVHRLFSVIKALALFLTPPLFLLGFIGKNRTEYTCNVCGQKWDKRPGKLSFDNIVEWFMYI